jgi:hypothetical protein
VRYADTLLAGGEVVLRRGRQHWMALLLDSRNALLLWVAGIAAFFLGSVVVSPYSDVLAELLGYLALALLLAGLALLLKQLWEWWAQDYLITNRRIVKVEGIVNKRSADSSLEKISDAVLRQDLLARLLGYGDLEIVTAAESAIDRYRMLDRPSDFKRAMLNAKHNFEMEMRYREPPGPPIHAPPARAGSAPAGSLQPRPTAPPAGAVGTRTGGSAGPRDRAVGSPAAGTPPDRTAPGAGPWRSGPEPPASRGIAPATTNAAEILDVLGRLADLRDRGAITAAEYEAKKAELLARL